MIKASTAFIFTHSLTLLFIIHQSTTIQWRIQVDQASRPFQFIHYDPIIQRKQREYRDQSTAGQNSAQSKSQLNDDLNEIQSIMRKNIDEILNRGEKLDQVSNISQELRSKSKDFKWGAKKLTWQARMQQYGPMVIGVVIVMIVLYVKIFHIGF
jgi:vesicle transport protein SEC22